MRNVLLGIVAFSLPAQFSFADQDNPALQPKVGESIIGERLDPSMYGPGVVESFDDVLAREQASPSEPKSKERDGRHGSWLVPSPRATGPTGSGSRYLTNNWGDTLMGIGFPQPVDVISANIGGQTNLSVTTSGLRIIGYLQGVEVGRTGLLRGLTLEPQTVDINLRNVDRIVFEAEAVVGMSGWYSLDDLTFAAHTGNGQPAEVTILDFEDLKFKDDLTGSGYRGLIWEEGAGPIAHDAGAWGTPMPAPAGPPRQIETLIDSEPEEGGDPRGGSGTNPNLLAEYQGVINGFDPGSGSFPPDTCGAIGPSHFVEVVNSTLKIFNKSNGTVAQNISLNSFMNGQGDGDPRVVFDTHSNRWIILATNFGSTVAIAVSSNSSATSSYFKTAFTVSAGSDAGCWIDHPTLGVDANGIYVGTYMVGCGLSIFAIDKAPLVAPSPSLGTITAFRGISTGNVTLQGVQVYGTPNPPGGYLMSAPGGSVIRFFRVIAPITSPTLTTVDVTVPSYSEPPDAPAQGSTTPLDTVGRRLTNGVYRNGFFYSTHCVNLGGRAGCRWYKISDNPLSSSSLNMSGSIDDPVRHYFFPSISVNNSGHVVLGFSGSSASQFAGCYYSGRLVNDPSGQTGVPQLLEAGTASYNVLDGVGRNRWGDYSLTTVDPLDVDTFWTIQEYAHGANQWGTRIGRFTYAPVDLTPPTPNPMTFSINPQPASSSSIYMQASLATDVASPPAEYFFDYVSGAGGHDSGWIGSRDYTDTGLPANSFFNYRVKARDSAAPNTNETAYSATVLTGTAIETPTGVSFGATDDTSIVVNADGSFSNVGFGSTGFYFEMTPAAGSGANVWVTNPTTTVTGLVPCTQYTFRVKARNLFSTETAYTSSANNSTTGCTGCTLLGDMNGSGAVEGGDIAGFVHAKLGVPQGGEFPECADYATGTLEGDTQEFVDDLLAP